jgi:hypothetical protein
VGYLQVHSELKQSDMVLKVNLAMQYALAGYVQVKQRAWQIVSCHPHLQAASYS